MTLLLKLRERAKGSKHAQWANTARMVADKLEKYLNRLHDNPSDTNMIALNGVWSVAERILKEYPAEPEPVPPRTNIMRLAA